MDIQNLAGFIISGSLLLAFISYFIYTLLDIAPETSEEAKKRIIREHKEKLEAEERLKANEEYYAQQRSKKTQEEILDEYIRNKKARETEEAKKAEEKTNNKKEDPSQTSREKSNTNRDQSSSTKTVSSQEIRCGTILGLKGKVTMADVKKRYRELVLQYHPDKVNHLGDKLKKLAEQEMKDINEAYEFFKRKYQ